MNKPVVLIGLLIAALVVFPLMLSSCSSNEEEDDGVSFDIDYDGKHKKSRSARSLGGSRSYSSGK